MKKFTTLMAIAALLAFVTYTLTPTRADAGTIEIRVSASTDDAEEKSGGSVSLTSSDLEFVFDRGGDQTVGMRFNGVDIPQGTTILNATIQFEVDEPNTVVTSLTIQGEAVDDATTFTSVKRSITSRPRTTAAVSWSPVEWPTRRVAGVDQQTPDIASVIQEIVDRKGWSNGNSLVIIISGTGERTAESFDGKQSAAAPLLTVEYTEVANTAPTVTITAPLNGTTVTEGTAITFTGTASDPEDGDLAANLAWTSDRDGSVGSGGSFSTTTLSADTHTITASVMSGGETGTDQIIVTVVSETDDSAVIGQWGSLINLPAVPVHSIMLHTGKVLFFRSSTSYTWDPLTGQINQQDPGFNIFCSAHSFLPDGRVLVTGGALASSSGPIYVNIFDPVTETWSQAPDMRLGRWYPTNLALGDGTTLIFAGKDVNGDRNLEVERFIPGDADNSDIIEYLEGGDKDLGSYPRMHLLPSGLALKTGIGGETATFDPVTHVWQFVADNNFGTRRSGTSVMLPPGHERIMSLGGHRSSGVATNTAEIIDMSQPSPTWSYTTPMNYARQHANAIILPDGKVLIAGGIDDGTNHGDGNLIPIPEMFDPETETWTDMAPLGSFRIYHSSAVLLPDGRVWWAGSNGNPSAEIFSPPYMFQGPRPIIDAAPEFVDYGETFNVSTLEAADIVSVVLIRPGSSTHSTNMEQRYVLVSFTQVSSIAIEVTAPIEPNIAPPGDYMLFIVNGDGIPSEARFVNLGGNVPRNVMAGLDQTITLPAIADLDGTVIGFDPSTLITTWSQVSSTGTATFADPNAVDTTASFFEAATYVLRLTAEDWESSAADDVTITVLETGSITTVEVRVSVGSDDAEERDDDSMDLTSSDLELVYNRGIQKVGMRFSGVEIPPGATIVNAYVQFQVDETPSKPTDLTIEGEAVDHAATFTTSSSNISSRPRTTAAVMWSPPPWLNVGEAGLDQQTPNIASVIQEIVDRPKWSSGNSLVIIITGTGERVAESYNGDPAGAPLLHVQF